MRFKTDKAAGMAAMLTGVVAFALMDAGLKVLAVVYPAIQVAALRGLAALPIVFVWAMLAGGPRQLVQVRWPLHLIRGALSVLMMVTFTYALQELSLARTYSLFFIAPMLIAILSMFFFGERVSRAQWIAILIGFCGVLIVLKPDASGFGWAGSLAVIGTALCYSFSNVLVKIIGRTDSTQAMVFWMTCMLAIGATLLALPSWQPVDEKHFLVMLGIAITGAIGQWGITFAFKHAPAASVAPLEYSGLAWVIVIDYVGWATIPGWRMLAGAAVIIGSGIYLVRHETRRAPEIAERGPTPG